MNVASKRLMRKQEVLHISGIGSNSTLYYLMNKGTFPVAVKISKKSVAWRESEVLDWIESREKALKVGGVDMKSKELRLVIRERTNSDTAVVQLLHKIDVDVTREGFFKVREERTPSCKLNKDGSCHDFGSGEHYSDVVSLLFDGYGAFESLPATMEWLCEELNIDKEAYNE